MVEWYRQYKAQALLLLMAVVWGFAFVPQRLAMDAMGPLAFNAARFALGGIVLLPLLRLERRRDGAHARSHTGAHPAVLGAILSGVTLFLAAAAQQTGLVYTTAGKAGFITGMYVIIVPMLGIFLGKKVSVFVWVGATLSLSGLYLLSVEGRESINQGDMWVLVSALFWAVQIHIIDRYARRMPPLELAVVQFFTCAVLSAIAAMALEHQPVIWNSMSILSVLYVGIFSTALAFSLQVYAQQISQAGPAAVIMNLESVFAALAGFLLLQEALPLRAIMGGLLMFAGMAAVSWVPKKQPLPGGEMEQV